MAFCFFRVFLVLLCCPIVCFAQEEYLFESITPKVYDNFSQNWSLAQDSSGYIIVGNGAGLIKFDGELWESIHVANEESVRSLREFEGTIYWGGQGDLGYVVPDSINSFSSKSVKAIIDSAYLDFSDVWHMGIKGNSLYLRTYERIFKLKKDTVEAIDSDRPIMGLFEFGKDILVQVDSLGFFTVSNKNLIPLDGSEGYINDKLYVVLPLKDQHLFISRQRGFMLYDGYSFHPFETEAADYVKEHNVYRAVYLNEQEIAIATLSGGIVIINTRGDLKSILTKEDGLPTDIIYELYVDREQTLWAATDNGLVKILVNNPVTKLDDQHGLEGIPTFLEMLNERTYIGSTEDIFHTDGNGRAKTLDENIGRVYDGTKNEDEIWAATTEGILLINEGQSRYISDEVFTEITADTKESGVFYGARDGSIFRLDYINRIFQQKEIVTQKPHVDELYVEDQGIWAVSYANGITRYDLSGNIKKKYQINLEESEQYQQVGFVAGRLRVGTDAGLYVLDVSKDSLVSDTTFNDLELLIEQVNLFKQCRAGEIWFRNNRKVRRAVLEGGNWNVIEDPYRLIDEGETITTISCGKNGTMWFGGTAGVYHLSNPDWKYKHKFNTNITGLLVHNDSLIYGGYGEPERDFELPFRDNELRFTYAAASFIAPEQNAYRVRLKGYDKNWSSWTTETEKDYTFIPEGTYTFEVQGRNVYHKVGTIDSFTFTILPPWYRTVWAYIAYVLLIESIAYALYRFRINSILREQRVRNRIASDLHDEVSATLSSISYFAEAIKKSPENGKGRRFVTLISESANDAKEKITDIIWSIDPENDDWVDLLSKCRRFASDLLESKEISYDLNIDKSINRPLDLQLRQHLWLIFKEMITNAARHSDADRVDIRLTHESGELTLVVQDNGKGFDTDTEREGNGIENIRKRAQKIKAEITLESDSAIGTRWILKRNL